MCGIVGIAGKAPVGERLLLGLKRLEYRGYDSSGLATVADGRIERLRAAGKLHELEKLLKTHPLGGTMGIGHTRWATHGLPNEANAHPHATERVALVHNGIVENYREIKRELEAEGVIFSSQTDTEVIVHLIDRALASGAAPRAAVAAALKCLRGAFALGLVFAQHPELLIAARRGSPLAIGYGEGEMYLGSDAIALRPWTKRIAYLEDGDLAELTPDAAAVYDEGGSPVKRAVKISALSDAAIGKGGFAHYMLKEIHEQPTVAAEAMSVYCDFDRGSIALPDLGLGASSIRRVELVACGSSFYAGLVARYWLEDVARIPAEVDIASEFRYRSHFSDDGTLAVFISQSGETADTLAAMRAAKAAGRRCLALVNASESTMAQEADSVLSIHAGPEIGVASTKAFTAQLSTLACLVLGLAQERGTLAQSEIALRIQALAEIPSRMVEVLHSATAIAKIARVLTRAKDVLYMGRGTSHAIALEGALKLKEISYIHAEGYPAGEMKHGPIALVHEETPVVVVVPSDPVLFAKTASNAAEIAARGGRLVVVSDPLGCTALAEIAAHAIAIPAVHPFAAPMLYALPMQILAYYAALAMGRDVDQPRNLAKSVTVE